MNTIDKAVNVVSNIASYIYYAHMENRIGAVINLIHWAQEPKYIRDMCKADIHRCWRQVFMGDR